MKQNTQGFTLIEVILVLAVGSLIFMMAFLAFSRASVNRRDSARRADLAKISGALEDYAADNNGKYPQKKAFAQDTSTFAAFANEYLGGLKDPSTQKPYTSELGNYNSVNSASVGSIQYFPEDPSYSSTTFCDNTPFTTNTSRDYVIRMKLEKGEACRDSRQ